jgi:hypothetical protein
VGALDAIFVVTDQAEKVLLDGVFVLRVPGDGEAHVEILRNELSDHDSWGTEVTNSGGNEGDALAGFDEGEDAGPGGGGVDDVRGETCVGAEGDDTVEEGWGHLAIAEDEAFGDKRFDRDGFAGEGMVAGKGDDDGVAIEELGAEGLVVGWLEGAGEGDVDLSGEESFHLLGRAHLVEGELDVGVELAVVADDAGEETAGAPKKEADVERADLADEGSPGDFDGAVGSGEGFTRFGEEELALGREAGSARVAVEERAADFALEIGDLLADGGLGDVEAAASFAEGAVLGDGAEITQMSEFHAGRSPA